MSFLNVLGKIVHVVGKVGTTAVPVVSLINPAIGGILGAVVRMIVSVEAQMPEDKLGPVKKEIVMKLANAKAQASGVTLDQEQLSTMIDALVDAMNKHGIPAPVNLGVLMGNK